ncbi:MAG TPA: CopG family transcriptional regulator [Lacisediminihabitans sp.]|uniref:CopG family transcriptional regulator n=1 Tax=Lacisediminihabitans sp. TaxID=2787631 RepID=UPI002ED9F8E3
MATNLRLGPLTERALRAEAERSGRSQQELIRDALDRYLGLTATKASRSDAALLTSGAILAPRSELRRARRRLRLPAGTLSGDLLQRDDRI